VLNRWGDQAAFAPAAQVCAGIMGRACMNFTRFAVQFIGLA
jgi:hypothetical protein